MHFPAMFKFPVLIQLHALQSVCGTSDRIIAMSSNVWLWMQEARLHFDDFGIAITIFPDVCFSAVFSVP